MKKLKFKILSIFGKAKANISILLTAVLLILVVFEALVVKRAISTVLNVMNAKPAVEASQLVRINFSAYDKIVKRIQDAPGYASEKTLYTDPFGTKTSSDK